MNRLLANTLGAALAALAIACLDRALAPAGPVAGEHFWVFHFDGAPYAQHVQLVAIGDREDSPRRRRFRTIPSRAWDGATVNDLDGFEAMPLDRLGWQWSLEDRSGRLLRLTYVVTGDTAIGRLRLPGGEEVSAFGVRFDSAVAGLVGPTLPTVTAAATPRVLLRVDDGAASDSAFLERVAARGLPAELAIPTGLLDLPGRQTWAAVQRWLARGMAVAAHSRLHQTTSADAQYFIAEVVGGFADLQAHAMASAIFVQPGTWRDSILFDTPVKTHTWRGALMRTFAGVSECYTYPFDVPIGRADSFALGLSHVTISDGKSEAAILDSWRIARHPNHSTVFLVHSYRLKRADQLDWFLDSVAAAGTSGAVAVVGNSLQLFRTPAPGRPSGKPAP